MRYRVEVTFPVNAVGYFEAESPEDAATLARDRAPFAVEFTPEGEGSEWEQVDILEVSEFEVEEDYPDKA